MPDPTAVINTVRQVRWDTPYRLLASLAGISAWVAFPSGTPLEAVRAVTSWLGFSVAANLSAAERWMLEPARRDVLAFICGTLVVAAAISLWVHGWDGLPNEESRAGATLVLAYAVLVQLGWLPASAILFVMIGAGVLGSGFFLARRSRDVERLLAVLLDIGLGFGWAPLFIGGWMLLPKSLVPAAPDATRLTIEQAPAADVSLPTGAAMVRP